MSIIAVHLSRSGYSRVFGQRGRPATRFCFRASTNHAKSRSAFGCLLAAGVAIAPALTAQCLAPEVQDAATTAWSQKVADALIGGDACYADKSAYIGSDCNIFAGRVLEEAYGVNDFVLDVPNNGLRYHVSNEIAVLLWTSLSDTWDLLGSLTDQQALNEAQSRASQGKPVIAVWRNDDPAKPGHIALIGPGPLTPSNSLGVSTPVSASFFQGRPEANYIGKPLACAFRASQAPNVRIYARK